MTKKNPNTIEQRAMARSIEAYLQSLHSTGDYGRRSREWYEKRVEQVQKKLTDVNITMVTRTKLVQQLRDYERVLEISGDGEDYEAEFIAVAAVWSKIHNIEYQTWREMGVPAKVLREAGL